MDKGTLEMLMRVANPARQIGHHMSWMRKCKARALGLKTWPYGRCICIEGAWAEDVAAWKMYSVCVDVGACASFCDVSCTAAHLLPGPPRGQVFNCHKM
jgi:hypothetical protein